MRLLVRTDPGYLLVFFLFLLGTAAFAEPSVPFRTKPGASEVTRITVGESVFKLGGPWKFTVGDSPLDSAISRPLWAQPGFDDSQWETISLAPSKPTIDPLLGYPDYVPGWTAMGHPGYSGYAWYRIYVKIDNPAGSRLALAGPDTVDDGFQVFADGFLVGSFGDFSSSHPVVYNFRPTIFPLPSAPDDAKDGTRVFALRVWMESSTLLLRPDGGGFHGPFRLGRAEAIADLHQVRSLNLARKFAEEPAEAVLCFLFVILAISFSVFDSSDKVYLWIALGYLLLGALRVVETLSSINQVISALTANVLTYAVFSPLIVAVWVMVWRVWFHLKRPAWLPKALVLLTLLYMAGELFGEELIFGLVPHRVAAAFALLSVAVRLCILGLLIFGRCLRGSAAGPRGLDRPACGGPARSRPLPERAGFADAFQRLGDLRSRSDPPCRRQSSSGARALPAPPAPPLLFASPPARPGTRHTAGRGGPAGHTPRVPHHLSRSPHRNRVPRRPPDWRRLLPDHSPFHRRQRPYRRRRRHR